MSKEFKRQARNFHIVMNKKSLPHLGDAIKYLKDERCQYLLCRKGLNKKGEEHAHIYVNYRSPRVVSSKNTFGAHIAKCRGTPAQNVAYIESHHPDLVEEFGTLPKGKADISEMWTDFTDELKEGKVDKWSKMYARYEGYANRRLAEVKPKTFFNGNLKHKNLWLWGPPRTGKSYWAEHFLPYDTYDKSPNKWWDGYQGEKVVILEDLDPEQAQYIAHYVKKWADRKPITAAVKCGSMKICPADFHFIVTSNYSIEECFNKKDARAIRDRMTVWHITEKMPNLPEGSSDSDTDRE